MKKTEAMRAEYRRENLGKGVRGMSYSCVEKEPPSGRTGIVGEFPMNREPTFTPQNEPYLGRASVHSFDLLIVESLAINACVAPVTHRMDKSSLQWAACQLIPQSVSLALSTRELIRQGYLFGALVLVRPLIERSVILVYLFRFPDALPVWERGWLHNEAPSLAKMLNRLGGSEWPGIGPQITGRLNAITHGKPESAVWSLINMPDGTLGHGSSKMLNNPQLCDEVCSDAAGALALVASLMHVIFPEVGHL